MNIETPPEEQQIIEKLAALNPIDYHRQRRQVAEALGVNVSAIDEAVKLARPKSDDSIIKGREINLYEPEPWPEPVDGADVLTEAYKHICRHMMISEADAIACTLWACHTYMFEDFDYSPRLCITASTEESGKTVLMAHLVGNLCNKPQSVELMKPAPFFRLAEQFMPTFLIDECDVFIREDMDLLAALNNGWEPHGAVIRCTGDDHEPRRFSTFTPVAMAGIDLHEKLPATTLGRSIVIRLERAAEGEISPEDFYCRKRHESGIRDTGRKIARFIQDSRQTIADHKPSLPPGVRNRQADKWSCLFAIADMAGGDWPSQVRRALYKQSEAAEPTKSLQLLQDVRQVLPPEGHIFTESLIGKLCALPDSLWVEYNFMQLNLDKKKISSRQMANQLKKYGVKPTTVNINGNRSKGYKREDLERAFRRYVPDPPLHPIIAVTPLPSNDNADYSDSSDVTSNQQVTDSDATNPSNNAGSNGVTDKSGEISDEEDHRVITV